MKNGIYEQIINRLILSKLESLDQKSFFIAKKKIDKAEAARILSSYLAEVINTSLGMIPGENSLENQLTLANDIITLIRDRLNDLDLDQNIIAIKGEILTAIFPKINSSINDYEKHLKEITPHSGLSQSDLFTGSHSGISLDSEIKKEILSSQRVDFLVSFIKWTGIRIFDDELVRFTNNGGKLRVITTSYMGATDVKAIQYLAQLKNTEIKISYNTNNERLHAKAYLFYRDSGFNTAYIGSSNISRAALTSGLEWNIKVTTKEAPSIIDKFEKTFDTYWADGDFVTFRYPQDTETLNTALKSESKPRLNEVNTFFDIKPFHFQEEILENLETERTVHNRYKNLIVAATGTGKTVISAFDYKRFRKNNSSSRLLFVAHRKEILQQALATFQGILRDMNFGELWVDGITPSNNNHVFASVQTIKSQIDSITLTDDFFDYVVIDEVHHISADSYRTILKKFKPIILLGLTATPERMDGANILEDFDNTIAAEIRLPEALNRKLLCPFQYFGITDTIDLKNVRWERGRYVPAELSKIYTGSDERVEIIIERLGHYLRDMNDVRALCFCITQEHAKYMAEKFSLKGIKSDYLVSDNSSNRELIRQNLIKKKINYLFVVDIFNEGVDVPEIDTVLFLRPTESLTVFLQQFGRGLRLADGKDCLTVLDFVGNARPEYDFEHKFRALIGKTNSNIVDHIESNFPKLPLGCTIILEKKAKEYILDNIKAAISLNKNQLIRKINNFKHQTNLELNLCNFIKFYDIPLQYIYNRKTWNSWLLDSQMRDDYEQNNDKNLLFAITNKWIPSSSYTYFEFILNLAENNFIVNIDQLSIEEKLMCMMLHYDFWDNAGGFSSLEESIKTIGKNPVIVSEIIEIMKILIERIDYLEKTVVLPYPTPLKLHSRYTRSQIFAALQFSSFDWRFPGREGVAVNKKLNTELLFIDLIKSEKDYSPSTLYNDFAVNERLFHWQTQNAARPDLGKGLSYIKHKNDNKIILLFVREQKKDEFDKTMSFVFLGEAEYIDHYGSKPMNINWELKEPMPHYIWKASSKMSTA